MEDLELNTTHSPSLPAHPKPHAYAGRHIKQGRKRARAATIDPPQPGELLEAASSPAVAAEAASIKRAKATPRARGDRTSTPSAESTDGSEGGVTAPAVGEEVMSAVLASMRADAASRVTLREDEPAAAEPESDARRPAAPGTVSFLRKGEKPPVAKKRKQTQAERHRAADEAAASRKPAAGQHRTANQVAVTVKVGQLSQASHVDGPQRQAVFGRDAQTWQGLGVSPELSEHLLQLGFKQPSKIQAAAIAPQLAGRHTLIQAQTGSGKTLAYLTPIVQRLAGVSPRISRAEGCHALVVVPTRELVIQVHDVLQSLIRRHVWMVSGQLMGGENRNHEKRRLRKGVLVLVATPGRLADHLHNTACFRTEELGVVVLDEADRLLDLGFGPKLVEILKLIRSKTTAAPESLQLVMASATMSREVAALAGVDLLDAECVGFDARQLRHDRTPVGGRGQCGETSGAGEASGTAGPGAAAAKDPEAVEAPKNLKQTCVDVPCKLRLVALAALLKSVFAAKPGSKVVIFLATCDSVEFHHLLLGHAYTQASGAPLVSAPLHKLHGNLPQGERTTTFLSFAKAASGVLLCTDVAARGLDFPSVSLIVQYDPPGAPAEYVHRIGRTARMGAKGAATLFLMKSELEYRDLLAGMGLSVAATPLLALLRFVPRLDGGAATGSQALGPASAGQKPSAEQAFLDAHALQKRLVQVVGGNAALHKLAGNAFRSYVRAYAAAPTAVKGIFHPKKLHLGHVAHSFGLSEPPTALGHAKSTKKLKAGSHGRSGGSKRRSDG